MSRFSDAEHDVIDRACRVMADEDLPMSDVLEELYSLIDSGNIGITANAKTIDALLKDADTFAVDGDLTRLNDATTGLTFALKAGRFWSGATEVTVAANTYTVTNNTTSYVQLKPSDGTVNVTTGGFTAGYFPLYTVTASGGVITAYTNKKPLIAFALNSAVTAAQLSSTAKRFTLERAPGGSVTGTAAYQFVMPNFKATLVGATVTVQVNTTASDTNYWSMSLENKGTDGTGSTAMLASGSGVNTTKATGGSAFDQYTQMVLTLHGTAANLSTEANQTLLFTLAETGTADNLSDPVIQLVFEPRD